jgi:arylsulfatase A-like enzyme
MRRKLPELDRGLATLLADLADRGLLDSTIVLAGGEFGRTPKVLWESPWNGGRGHWGKAFSALVAGGGFKGGHVVGKTDAHGEEVTDKPVLPVELIGRMYESLGIAADAKLPHPEGSDVRVMPTAADGAKRGTSPLAEILASPEVA